MTTINELLPIQQEIIDQELVQTVNARELHNFLESRQDFSTWIKNRIKKYDFEENKDFVLVHKIVEQVSGAKHLIEYHISLDMAKELSMVENNPRGKEARRYFIECEKKLQTQHAFNLPSNYKEALIALVAEVEKNERLEVELEVAKPKVEYYDAILDSSELLTTTIIAKNHGLTAQKLHEFLHQQRVIYKQGDKWYVYQEHLDKGLMRTRTYLGEDGNTITYFKWTKKGEAFINDLINEKGFLSVIFGRHIAL